jgi:ferritin-like metal-binding protein YciE
MAEDKTQRTLRYLADTHATEIGGIAALEDLLSRATDAEVRAAVNEKIAVGQTQVQRLEARIRALGGSPSGAKALVQTAGAKASRLMNLFHDQEDKQTQDLVKAYALAHFEVGVYRSLEAYADAVGDDETARLAREIRGEEEAAAAQLEKLIPRVSVKAVDRTENVAGPMVPASAASDERALPGPVLLWLPVVAVGLWWITRLIGGDGDAPTVSPEVPVESLDTVDRETL